jgi:predicted RNase H-like HicB family nuclease
MNGIRISVFWSEEDGGYIAKFDEAPEAWRCLSAFGDSPIMAYAELCIAWGLMIELEEEDGNPA